MTKLDTYQPYEKNTNKRKKRERTKCCKFVTCIVMKFLARIGGGESSLMQQKWNGSKVEGP